MNYLLDTHAFIWLNGSPSRLSPRVTALCSDPAHTLWLSLVSVWEMQIKLRLGKLRLPAPLPTIISSQQTTNRIQLLSIELPHILMLDLLPDHHKDPFDRLLITQAQRESFILITNDPLIARYSVAVLW
ncbi:hypothetical protein ANRL4_02860 [Anaerolineae bacterium]|nr:hypothetical protein ANRL4_02860 [Anaerolineae bacterium]